MNRLTPDGRRLVRGHRLLHRSVRLGLLLGVATMALALAAVASGSPGNGAVRVPVGNTPFDLSPDICGFPIHVGVVADKEYFIHDTTLADGTEILRVTGKLVLSFTNEDTGKTIVDNASGPGTATFFPDGSAVIDSHGHTVVTLGPADQATTGEPGLVFSSGHLVATFGPTGSVQSFTLSGTQTNGCALLGP
jgi:hypothetical protein